MALVFGMAKQGEKHMIFTVICKVFLFSVWICAVSGEEIATQTMTSCYDWIRGSLPDVEDIHVSAVYTYTNKKPPPMCEASLKTEMLSIDDDPKFGSFSIYKICGSDYPQHYHREMCDCMVKACQNPKVVSAIDLIFTWEPKTEQETVDSVEETDDDNVMMMWTTDTEADPDFPITDLFAQPDNKGVIIGAVIGAFLVILVVILVVIIVVIIVCKKRKSKAKPDDEDLPVMRAAPVLVSNPYVGFKESMKSNTGEYSEINDQPVISPSAPEYSEIVRKGRAAKNQPLPPLPIYNNKDKHVYNNNMDNDEVLSHEYASLKDKTSAQSKGTESSTKNPEKVELNRTLSDNTEIVENDLYKTSDQEGQNDLTRMLSGDDNTIIVENSIYKSQ